MPGRALFSGTVGQLCGWPGRVQRLVAERHVPLAVGLLRRLAGAQAAASWIDGASHNDLYDKAQYVGPAITRFTGFFTKSLASDTTPAEAASA